MFPEIPADLSALSADELQTLLDECRAAYAAARPTATTVEQIAELRGFAANVSTVRDAHTAALATAAEAAAAGAGDDDAAVAAAAAAAAGATELSAEAQAELDALDAEFAAIEGDTATGAGDDTGDEPALVTEDRVAELVDAAVTAALADRPTRVRVRREATREGVVASIADLNARRDARSELLPGPSAPPFTITASADVPGVPMGAPLTQRGLAEAMIARSGQLGHGSGGPDDKVPVASFNLERGEARTLSDQDYQTSNLGKIREATAERESIMAAGGLCAPVNNRYEQTVISESWRPVMASMPSFSADRGGIRFNPPPALADVTSGVDRITAAADLAGGAGAVKACFAVTCAAIVEVDVEADYVCVEFGNFGARTFPENVEAWMELAAAAHARSAEGNRLTDIKTGAPAVTAAGLTGAGRELLTRLEELREGINSNARRPHDAPVEVILEQWAIGLIRADFTRSLGDGAMLSLSDEEIGQMFADRHLAVTLTPDSATGNSSIMAAPATGVIKEYPTAVHAEVFVPGTYLALDAGRLDLGLVRDSALTMGSGSTPGNRFRMFYENFEALAVVGPAGSRAELTLSLCANGTYGAAKAVTCPIVS